MGATKHTTILIVGRYNTGKKRIVSAFAKKSVSDLMTGS